MFLHCFVTVANKEVSVKLKQSEQCMVPANNTKRAKCLSKQIMASVSINQQESDDAESDAKGDKEGNKIKVEFGVQTDELYL